ncbi:degenerin-like protein asic-1 [Gigantopelta aegis]|uniref:degenerin-like protein asic-1 n=1 Tax=Gigantopelta aegis TaxID=1735272 RepID=UPI001B8877BA|nr:degenerin-like protein asic-1 [Gigantopelta aegis]
MMNVVKTTKTKDEFEHKPLVGKAKEAFMRVMDKSPEPSLSEKVAVFFNETSFTPLVRIYNASNWFKRICWLVVVLGMLSWLSVQCIWLFQRYFRYPVEVKMDIVFAKELEFPSVTVCNMNPLKRSMTKYEPYFLLEGFVDPKPENLMMTRFMEKHIDEDSTQFLTTYTPPPSEVTTTASQQPSEATTTASQPPPESTTTASPPPESTTTSSPPPESTTTTSGKRWRKRDTSEETQRRVATNKTYNQWTMLEDRNLSTAYYQQRDMGYRAAMKYASFSQLFSQSVVMAGGHSIMDFIVSCKMGGFMCSPMNFTQFLNHKYGNCFTFNGPDNLVNLSTRFAGPIYGLSLEMYIEQKEYIGSLTQAAGVRVLIHPRNSMPFPEDQGISIPPGYETYVGIRMVDIGRLPEPHGTCASEGTEPDLYMTYQNTTYSKLSCMKSCYQRIILENCGCAVPFFYVVNWTNGCNMSDPETEMCVKELPSTQSEAYDQCNVKCPPPCSEVKFEKTISSAQWPSGQYAKTLSAKIKQTSYQFMSSEINPEKEFAKLDVYYEDLMYEKIEQQQAYESPNLISDVGGQLGLWLGLSAFTLGELLSFLVSLAKTVCLQRRNRAPVVTPVEKLDLNTIRA